MGECGSVSVEFKPAERERERESVCVELQVTAQGKEHQNIIDPMTDLCSVGLISGCHGRFL